MSAHAGKPIAAGLEIDGFTVGERLHKGGMASIWDVRHPDIAVPLVLKAPFMAQGHDPAAIVSFEMEMMILPRLSGTHVPKVHAVGDFMHQPYIVMERIEGQSLYPRIETLPRPIEEVIAIGSATAYALEDIHRQDVVHLDIKPSNIMIRPNGTAVLIDFGLARHVDLPDLIAEEFRLPYGTAPYISPEQTFGVRGYRRSDIFALGVLLYFFATGERPFGDPQSLKGLQRRWWDDPCPPRQRRPDLPPWLQEVILRCIEPDPERRYPSAAHLAFDLRHPRQVLLTERAHKLKRDSWFVRRSRRDERARLALHSKSLATSKRASAPIVAAAVALTQNLPALDGAMRQALVRVLDAYPDARLACLNVLRQNPLKADETLDEAGRNKHAHRLAELAHWAEPLNLPPERITFHVLEAMNPADAVLEYARMNHVDHIVMGARAESLGRRILGSVSAEVAAHAPCTVTVVRPRGLEPGEEA